ncbi:MAG: hypothetical protein MUE91_08710 [Ignavibacteriaceae bacterium]|jgi:hypothetical protein|nr:hypothetical protein [Ignavibacteriaceae bacterium]
MGNYDAEIESLTLNLVIMKQIIRIVCSLIIFVCLPAINTNIFAQNPVCAYCGIPMSAATRNSDHKPSCRYYTPPKSSTTSSSKTSSGSTTGSPASVSEVIIQSVISNILSAPDPKQQEAEEKAKQLELERIAFEKAEKKRIQDEIDLANHNKLMESFKPLPGSQSLEFKGLPTTAENVAKTTSPELLGGATEALQEQNKFETDTATWIEFQKKMLKDRLSYSNKWSAGLSNSLTSKVPPLPDKKFDELQSGDVLLIAPATWDLSKGIRWVDQLASGSSESAASHTVTYLKEVNGQKLFMDNQPFKGPTIISEKQLIETYGHRSMDVAQLSTCGVAQPLNDLEAEKLFKVAVQMQSENLKAGNSNYGVWGKNDILCSESSWALIKASGRKISGTDFGIKSGIGVDFSPADFYAQKQYFLVTPLTMSKQ